ncbi:MAG: chromosome segregation protein SMC [Chloroflexi bacterium 13_1_40CM_4_68_4]|nr:MAG: chromosome segregation protein SMC [Chloroflexi bacterium 13_1_40CM_4_68_4]
MSEEKLRLIEGGADKPQAVLRTLTMTGFKSFATKTYFEFAPGMTVIVGPNGSGKSNCAEAIRWALGEGNARQLRAKKSEDLIFAGSETRKAIGMAEVVLHLDNSSGRLPISFTEVEIARRFYRSTESDYLVNRTKVRLRDLQDLLAGANLADNPFVVIGQGLVDQVLALKPSDRRIVIEEAAGTRRLHLRREEALAKLVAAEGELVRVNDILREIGPRRELLEEQAGKWREYESVRAELRRRALRWYRDSYGESATARDDLRSRLLAVDAELAHIAEDVGSAEGAAIVDEEGLTFARADEERARADAQAAGAADTRAREELAALRASLAAIAEQHGSAAAALASIPAEIALLTGRLERLDAEASGAAETARHAAGRLAETERALAQRQAVASVSSAQRLAAEREALLRESAVNAARNESGSLQRREAALAEHARQIDAERAERSEERDAIASGLERARRAIGTASRSTEALATESGTLHGELARIEAELVLSRGRIGAFHEALTRANDELETRRRALAADSPALPQGLWWLFERVHVPHDVEPAVRAALGARVVVSDSLERTASLRESGLRDAMIVAGLPAAAPRGVPGTPLSEALEYADPDAATVARAVLGGVYLVEQERTALSRAKDLPPGVRLVTRSGVAVERGAARIVADAADDLAARRRLAQVEDAISRLSHERDAARTAERDLEAERDRLASTLAERERSLEDARNERSKVEADERRLLAHDAGVHDAIRAASARLDALERERGEVRSRLAALSRESDAANAARAESADALARAEGAERLALDELRESEGAAAGARLETATAEQRRATTARVREALTDQIAAAERRRQLEAERVRALATHEEDVSARVSRGQHDADDVAERTRSSQEIWERTRERAISAENARRDSEQRAAKGRERMAELRGERSRLAAEEERANAALRLLDEQVRAELGLADDEPLPAPASIDIEVAEPGRTAQQELRDLQKLRRRLMALEPVNPLAAEELAEVAQRHDFLRTHQTDLEKAITDLRSLAAELARTIAEQFSSTLLAVDREFAAFFTRLFNGGSASLRIAESDDDREESGIDILARPPGKRVSSLAQLSGGERALTAVALLLAILRVRPAPFCVLDEVDAALDERNVGRFTQALRELTDRTQFVVITHNRATIEAADALYGVSMDASGVSKVVSLRLADLDRAGAGSA